MPYITKERNQMLKPVVDKFAQVLLNFDVTEGDLNYLLTRAVICWTRSKGVNYRSLNAAIGVLSAAQHEFYRRVVLPYEDKKIKENGDIFDE